MVAQVCAKLSSVIAPVGVRSPARTRRTRVDHFGAKPHSAPQPSGDREWPLEHRWRFGAKRPVSSTKPPPAPHSAKTTPRGSPPTRPQHRRSGAGPPRPLQRLVRDPEHDAARPFGGCRSTGASDPIVHASTCYSLTTPTISAANTPLAPSTFRSWGTLVAITARHTKGPVLTGWNFSVTRPTLPLSKPPSGILESRTSNPSTGMAAPTAVTSRGAHPIDVNVTTRYVSLPTRTEPTSKRSGSAATEGSHTKASTKSPASETEESSPGCHPASGASATMGQATHRRLSACDHLHAQRGANNQAENLP